MKYEQEDIEKLYLALIDINREYYFNLRAILIIRYGYEKFRDIQIKSFELITKNHKTIKDQSGFVVQS